MRYDIILSQDAVEELRALDAHDDWELENDLLFLQRIETARQGLEEGEGLRLEDVEE